MRKLVRRGALICLAASCLVALAAFVWRERTSVTEIRPNGSTTAVGNRVAPSGNDWPWWRGTLGDNVAPSGMTRTQWADGNGVLWKRSIPGRGHASPILWGDRIYVLTADEAAETQSLLCYRKDTGEPEWERVLFRGGLMVKHEKNSHASATPACDGTHIYAVVANGDAIRVTAVNLDGTIAWQVDAGPYVSEWGYGSSPAVFEDLVIVAGDNRGSKLERLRATSFLAALNRETGDIVWRVKRPEERSYGSPAVFDIGGKPVLIMTGPGGVFAYNPRTGDSLWVVKWGATRTGNTATVMRDTIFATASFGGRETVGVRPRESAPPEIAWRTTAAGADIPSPLAVGDRVYVADDTGIVVCLSAQTGKTIWKERVAQAGVSASPFFSGGFVYLIAENGDVHVLRDGPEYSPVSKIRLGEPVLASPAASDGRLYIRTEKNLWCVDRK